MKTKGDAHEALSLLFQCTGVTDHLLVYVSKEKLMGSYKKKCSKAGYHLKQTELYSPGQNSVEETIREINHRSGRK